MMTARILLLLFFLGASVYGFSQNDKKTIEDKSVEMTEKLSKTVILSKEQYDKAKLLYLSYLKEKKALNVKIKALEREKKKLKLARNNSIDKLLTPEQVKMLELKKKKRNSKRRKK